MAFTHMTLFNKTRPWFLRLNTAKKMRLVFFPLVIFLLVVSVFALTKLNQLTNLNESVLLIDIPIQDTIKQMAEKAIDQESILRRFLIIKDNTFLDVFDEKGLQFTKGLNSLKTFSELSEDLHLPLTELEKSYSDYASTMLERIKLVQKRPDITSDLDETFAAKQTDLLHILSEIASIAKSDQNKKIAFSSSIGTMAFKYLLTLCIVGISLSAAGATIVTNSIVNAVRKLHDATEEISRGKFDHLPGIDNKDELGDLAKAFVAMGKRLKSLEEMYLDASPLTRLPGGIAIENILKKKIEDKMFFAFCLLDIDNFKSFNDHYGYAQGNKMIQATVEIIEEIIAKHGSPDDFIGHIGGDDFVIITTTDQYKTICQGIIEKFDQKIPTLYSEQDRKRGYIPGQNRQGVNLSFPLATISIGVVTNKKRAIINHIEVGEIAAEIKDFSKSITGSSVVIDQRDEPVSTTENEGELLNYPGKVS